MDQRDEVATEGTHATHEKTCHMERFFSHGDVVANGYEISYAESSWLVEIS